jgi:phosphogluconate dehydratase
MLMEMMGLHLPGMAFVNPGTPLRDALTVAATERVLRDHRAGRALSRRWPHGRREGDRQRMVGLPPPAAPPTTRSIWSRWRVRPASRSTGTIWTTLSRVVPLLARVYPNGAADVNHFQAAGGMGYTIRELLGAGLLHRISVCVHGGDLHGQAREPWLDELVLRWREPPASSFDESVLRPARAPFDREGGLRRLEGNLGRAVVKLSAVAPEHRALTAPARIFDSQDALLAAFKAGALDQGDFVAVVRGQGPRANGMPELHKLTPALGVMQDRGQRVALLTDGRMSGASGKVLAAIHLTPEAACHGAIAKLRDGDLVCIDAVAGVLEAQVEAGEWAARATQPIDAASSREGVGRELFGLMRANAGTAEEGACSLFVRA